MTQDMLGKVVLITGAARGQGRSHAIGFAARGADVIGVDVASGDRSDPEYPPDPALQQPYPLATMEDFLLTQRMVCSFPAPDGKRKMWCERADVRYYERLRAGIAEAVESYGRLDYVIANAGINPIATDMADTGGQFVACLDVMVGGVLNTIEAALPHLMAHGEGGAIQITSSTTGLRAQCPSYSRHHLGLAGYTAAKHAVVGLMRHYANALAEFNIRVNTVHPAGVATDMVLNPAYDEWFGAQDQGVMASLGNPLHVPGGLLPPSAVTDTMLHLCSAAGRYITGTTVSVDAGYGSK